MSDERPTLAAIFLAFLRLGLTAFGGPAMVAYIFFAYSEIIYL